MTVHEIRSSDHASDDSGSPSEDQQPLSGPSGGQSSSGSSSGQGSVNFQTAQFGLSVRHVSMTVYCSEAELHLSQVVQHPSNQINDLLLQKVKKISHLGNT